MWFGSAALSDSRAIPFLISEADVGPASLCSSLRAQAGHASRTHGRASLRLRRHGAAPATR